jgi:hypothetical protein
MATSHNRRRDDHDTHGSYNGFPPRVNVLLLKCNNNFGNYYIFVIP